MIEIERRRSATCCTMRQADGTLARVSADLVLGCDGVHSRVRAQLVPDEGPPKWNGVIMWRGVTRHRSVLDGHTMFLAGYFGRRMVVYPVGANGASQAILDARILARELAVQASVAAAIAAYDALRRPVTSAVVLTNRGAGPERSMDLVEQRAPDGFADIEDVIRREELHAIARDYKRVAGFDPDLLNQRESWSVR